MNSIARRINLIVYGNGSPENTYRPVFLSAAILFSVFHLSSGIITAVRSGICAMSIIGMVSGIIYAGIIAWDRFFHERAGGQIILILFLFIDISVIWFLSSGTIGTVLYMAMPAITATLLLVQFMSGLTALGIWIFFISSLFAVEYYYPENIKNGFIFFDGYFDTIITFLFAIFTSGVLILINSCSGALLRNRYRVLKDRSEDISLALRIAEEKGRESEGFTIDYPVRTSSELSGILEYVISPLDSVLEGEFGNRVSRRTLTSIRAGAERTRQYVLNLKFLALMEHGITEPLSMSTGLDSIISESTLEFHERFGIAVPDINYENRNDMTIGASDPVLLKRAFINILYACGLTDKSSVSPVITVQKSTDTATVIFSPGSAADRDSVTSSIEILSSDMGDPFAVYRENWLSLIVAKKIIELHNGSIIADIPLAGTAEVNNYPSVIVRLPVINK